MKSKTPKKAYFSSFFVQSYIFASQTKKTVTYKIVVPLSLSCYLRMKPASLFLILASFATMLCPSARAFDVPQQQQGEIFAQVYLDENSDVTLTGGLNAPTKTGNITTINPHVVVASAALTKFITTALTTKNVRFLTSCKNAFKAGTGSACAMALLAVADMLDDAYSPRHEPLKVDASETFSLEPNDHPEPATRPFNNPFDVTWEEAKHGIMKTSAPTALRVGAAILYVAAQNNWNPWTSLKATWKQGIKASFKALWASKKFTRENMITGTKIATNTLFPLWAASHTTPRASMMYCLSTARHSHPEPLAPGSKPLDELSDDEEAAPYGRALQNTPPRRGNILPETDEDDSDDDTLDNSDDDALSDVDDLALTLASGSTQELQTTRSMYDSPGPTPARKPNRPAALADSMYNTPGTTPERSLLTELSPERRLQHERRRQATRALAATPPAPTGSLRSSSEDEGHSDTGMSLEDLMAFSDPESSPRSPTDVTPPRKATPPHQRTPGMSAELLGRALQGKFFAATHHTAISLTPFLGRPRHSRRPCSKSSLEDPELETIKPKQQQGNSTTAAAQPRKSAHIKTPLRISNRLINKLKPSTSSSADEQSKPAWDSDTRVSLARTRRK